MKLRPALFLGTILGLASVALADTGGLTVTVPPEGSVPMAEGLAAWDRINEVFTHPRCINCHVDADAAPLWTLMGETATRPHGMNIIGGDSRIGAQTLTCSTCHVTSERPNTLPHAPPHTNMDWQLAPVEFVWTGRTSPEICAQVRNPDTNGDRDLAGLIEHITHDAEVGGLISWGFNPGGGRDSAPGTLQSHLDDIIAWGTAGMPCPEE